MPTDRTEPPDTLRDVLATMRTSLRTDPSDRFWEGYDAAIVTVEVALDTAARGDAPTPEPLREALRARLLAERILDRWHGDPDDDLAILARAVVRLNERIAATESPDTRALDVGSELGRLLAERDRLIAAGADPDDLLTPDPRSDQ